MQLLIFRADGQQLGLLHGLATDFADENAERLERDLIATAGGSPQTVLDPDCLVLPC